MKTRLFILGLILGSVSISSYAHSPLCSCYREGDNKVTCEGGFTDGSSAAGVAIRVVDMSDKVLLSGKMDEQSQYTFEPPQEDFHIVFDAGENHSVTIYNADIEDE